MNKLKLVMIGNGMAGVRTLEELLKLSNELYDITVFGDHPALDPVDLHHFAVEQQLDVVVQVPAEVVEHDLFEGLFAGQHGESRMRL